MSFDSSWDVDQYKTEYESEEHWELRRNFMLKHKDSYPEERLVCLAQVFTNVEFLGCRYPSETMKLVAQLSEGVADDYREKQKSKLKRTFVKASDAAEAKFKGLKRPFAVGEQVPSKIAKYSNNSVSLEKELKNDSVLLSDDRSENITIKKNNLEEQFTNSLSPKLESGCVNGLGIKLSKCASTSSPGCKVDSTSDLPIAPQIDEKEGKKRLSIEDIRTKKFGLLLIMEAVNENPFSTLVRSTRNCGIQFDPVVGKVDGKVCCRIYVNNQLVVSVSDESKIAAQSIAVCIALERLKDECFTFKIKELTDEEMLVVKKEDLMISEIQSAKKSRIPIPEESALATPLPKDNIGSKLMRSMGWTGGGLGKAEQGIQEPVRVSLRVNRAGLGTQKKCAAGFRKAARLYLWPYFSMDVSPKLIINSYEFSVEERETIFQLAISIGFQCKVVGKGDASHFVISKKDLFQEASDMIGNNELENEHYKLIKPRRPNVDYSEFEVLEASTYHLSEKFFRLDDFEMAVLNNLINLGVSNIKPRKPERRKGNNVNREILKSIKSQKLREIRQMRLQKLQDYALDKVVVGPYGSFFLIDCEEYVHMKPKGVLNDIAKYNLIPIKYMFGNLKSGVWCKIYINNHLLTTKSGPTTQLAESRAALDAYEKLKQICYTLKIKKAMVDKLCGQEDNSDNVNALDTPMGENVGAKLMRAMGWTGGGLGKDQQGIEEPVRLSKQVDRSGLGRSLDNSLSRKFCNNAENLIKNYIKKGSLHDLVFSTDYTKEERACLHTLATKYRLHSRSYGPKRCRTLVISRYRSNVLKIVENLLKTENYANEDFELIKPSIIIPAESNSNLQENKCLFSNVAPASTTLKLNDNLELSETSSAIPENMKDNNKMNSCSSVEKYPLNNELSLQSLKAKHPFETGQFGFFILIEDGCNLHPAQVIEKSANSCRVQFGYQYENSRKEITCKLLINNALVSSCTGPSKKAAREKTLMKGIAELREICYTLRIEELHKENSTNTIKTLIPPNIGVCKNESKAETQISCESKQITKAAVGIKGDEMRFVFKNKVRTILKEYISDISPHDLVISSEFSSPEQMCIQQLASSVALKSTLRGEPRKQVLIVSKKLTPLDTAQVLLHLRCNSSNCVLI